MYKWKRCKTSDIEAPPLASEPLGADLPELPEEEKADQAHEWRASELDARSPLGELPSSISPVAELDGEGFSRFSGMN